MPGLGKLSHCWVTLVIGGYCRSFSSNKSLAGDTQRVEGMGQALNSCSPSGILLFRAGLVIGMLQRTVFGKQQQ